MFQEVGLLYHLYYLVMAESFAAEESRVEQLEKEITCGICQEHYTEPKLLPCFHYFCEKCILRLVQTAGPAKPVSCPECRFEVTLTEQKVGELKAAFFITRLKANILAVSQGKREVKCELCVLGNKAEAYCPQCAMNICSSCIDRHKELKIFRNHEIKDSPLDASKLGSTESFTLKISIPQCEDHREPLTIYCFDCNCLICHCCVSGTHEDHNYELCSKASPAVKKNLQECLKSLEECKNHLTQAIAEIQSTKNELSSQENIMAESVRASFRELRDFLDQGEHTVLADITGKVEKKIAKLSMQENSLSIARCRFQRTAKYVEKCIENSTATELMTLQADLKKQVQSEVEILGSVAMYEKLGVKPNNLYQGQKRVALHLNSQHHSEPVTLVITGRPELGKISKASLTNTTGFVSKMFHKNFKVTSKLVSIRSGDVVECQVDSSAPDGYSIQFTPTVRGRHKLNVFMNEKEVTGSPFPVFVFVSLPNQLEKAVSTWYYLENPVGVAVNSKNEVLVALSSGSIIRFDTEGSRQTLFKQSQYGLCSLMVDENDDIYCKTNQKCGNITIFVLKISSTGIILFSRHLQYANTYLPNSIAFMSTVGNQFLVCCGGSKVYAYDPTLIFAGHQFSSNCLNNYSAASLDTQGNIYCADMYNSCIQVYNNKGVYLRCFDRNRRGAIVLRQPNFVRVLDKYVYITDSGEPHNLFVFTTDGEHLCSYRLPHPFLGIDADGYIYGVYNRNVVYRY